MTGEEAAVWTRHGAADPVAAATMASWPGRLYRSAGLKTAARALVMTGQ